jgi:hypothetical protein
MLVCHSQVHASGFHAIVFRVTPDSQGPEIMMKSRLEEKAVMYSNSETKRQNELTRLDLKWIFGAMVVLALMCCCILVFGKQASALSAAQKELLLRPANPIAAVQPPNFPAAIPSPNDRAPMTASPQETPSAAKESVTADSGQPSGQISNRSRTDETPAGGGKNSKGMAASERKPAVRHPSDHRKFTFKPRNLQQLIARWFRPFSHKNHG